MNRGKRLKKNDTIGIIAPASFAENGIITKAVEVLRNLGYQIKLGASCNCRWYSFSGDDQCRATDINEFFRDPTIDAILCLRGGYGSIRILNKIDWDLAKQNPKIFIGYSDVTALHSVFNQRSDLISFHGPMLAANMACNFDKETQNSLEKSVCTGFEPYEIKNPPDETLKTLYGGRAEGILTGGNLQTLISIIGTPYEPDWEGKILFIEEVNEAAYRIDRALSQLLLTGKLQQITGIILGDFKDCKPESSEEMPLIEVFYDRLGSLKVPIIYNLRSGHCKPKVTLPLGALTKINAGIPKIEILEKVVD